MKKIGIIGAMELEVETLKSKMNVVKTTKKANMEFFEGTLNGVEVVILAIEPVYKHIVCNPKRARKVLDEIGSPNLQIIFDPVNLLDISNYKGRESIIAEAIEVLGEDIAVIHIKDFIVKDGALVSVAAGTGEMDYTQIIRFIKEKKPYIHTTLENTTPENAVQAKAYIQKLYDTCQIK